MTKRRRTTKSAAKEARNQEIIAESLSGKSGNEIAEEYGLSRSAVTRILNSDEMKKLVELQKARLATLSTKAVDTIEWAMDNRAEFGIAGAALKSAITILKSMGAITESLDLKHTFPKPTVIQRRDGSSVVLGSKEEEKD